MTPIQELRLRILEMRGNYWHGNGPFGREDDAELHLLRRIKMLEDSKKQDRVKNKNAKIITKGKGKK